MSRGGLPLGVLVAAMALGGAGRGVHAAELAIATSPSFDANTGRVWLVAGAHSDDGRSVRAVRSELIVGGESWGAPAAEETLAELSLKATAASATWRPPIALGLVYLYTKDVPESIRMLDGIYAYVRRLPARTTIYPTPYGRMRQGRAAITPADISRLEEVQYLDGYRPNLAEAIRLNLVDLRGDPSPLKVLLVITDGRDFADPDGEHPADFAALGLELRSAGLKVQIVSFTPGADADRARSSLRDLRDSAAAFLRPVQPEEFESALESLGQAVGDLRRLEFDVPWRWRTLGGEKKLAVRLHVAGRALTVEAGRLSLPVRWGVIVGLGLILLVPAGGAVVFALARARGARRAEPRAASDDDESFPEVLKAAHEMVSQGLPAARAVARLTARFPNEVGKLGTVDPEKLPDELFPVFHVRAGRNRFQEIRGLLAQGDQGKAPLGGELAKVLLDLVLNKIDLGAAVSAIISRVPAREWKAFSGMKLDELAEALRAASATHPPLGPPKARGVALSLQDALRARGAQNVCVGWLVCASGPMARGLTIPLTGKTNVLGSGASQVRIDDQAVVRDHVRIDQNGERWELTPLGGAVGVEGQIVSGTRALVDGEIIALGHGQYVFKQASG